MPRKPNYSFERAQRQRTKAAKQEAKREAKAGAKANAAEGPADDTEQAPENEDVGSSGAP